MVVTRSQARNINIALTVYDNDDQDARLTTSEPSPPEFVRRRSTASLVAATSSSDSDGDNENVTPRRQSAARTKTSREKKFTRCVSAASSKGSSDASVDAKAHLDKRIMTPTQEWFNAVTMLPGMIYSAWFILSGRWTDMSYLRSDSIQNHNILHYHSEGSGWVGAVLGNEGSWGESFGCLRSEVFPHLKALPPMSLVGGMFACWAHSSMSIIYHGFCATKLRPHERIPHWTRRLDQASIHFSAACASYATTGRLDYFVINAFFNLDSALKYLEKDNRPRRNLSRIAAAIALYILPVIVYGHYLLFLKLLVMFGLCGWLFVRYPVGGWSHGLFHLVLTFLPVFIMAASMELESTQVQIALAAKCADTSA